MKQISKFEAKLLEFRSKLDDLNDAQLVEAFNALEVGKVRNWQLNEYRIQFKIRRLSHHVLKQDNQALIANKFILHQGNILLGKDAPIYILQQIITLYYALDNPIWLINNPIVYGIEDNHVLVDLNYNSWMKIEINSILLKIAQASRVTYSLLLVLIIYSYSIL